MKTTVAHGPWQAADCQQVLTCRLDSGLIDCIAVSWATRVRSDEIIHFEYDADWRSRSTEDGQHLILARDDARALPSDPSTWRADGAGAGVIVWESRQARDLPFDDWFDKLTGLPDHLIDDHPRDGMSNGQPRKNLAEPSQEVRIAGVWTAAMEQFAISHSIGGRAPSFLVPRLWY